MNRTFNRNGKTLIFNHICQYTEISIGEKGEEIIVFHVDKYDLVQIINLLTVDLLIMLDEKAH